VRLGHFNEGFQVPDVLPDTQPKQRWSRKQKRTYRHLINGIKISKKIGSDDLKFITLTTSDICVDQRDYDSHHDLARDGVRLRQRIERMSPWKLYKFGYLTRKQLPHFYDRNTYTKRFGHIDYLQVYTDEGNGVIHILGRFPYLPYNYLSSEWFDVHLSFDVNITRIDLEYGARNTAGYIVSQYIAGQGTSYQRSSMSRNWIFPGHSRIWKYCLDESKDWSQQRYIEEFDCWSAPVQIDLAVKAWDSYLEVLYGSKPRYHTQYDLYGSPTSISFDEVFPNLQKQLIRVDN
jgi:hypothetical protein